VGKRGGAWAVVVQWTANTEPRFVDNVIRARSKEQGVKKRIRNKSTNRNRREKG
jgi:hypothetical protein